MNKPSNQPEKQQSGQNLVPEMYANTILINVSPFELEIQNQLMDSTGVLKNAINVRLSPQTAKSFALALNGQIDQYEKQFGSINLPKVK